jgi:hypothetical protein
MAQLGNLAKNQAAPAAGRRCLWPVTSDRSAPARHRETEIALVCPDLGWALKPLMLPIRRFNAMRSRSGARTSRPSINAHAPRWLTDEANAHVLALLGDGESCSSSALALALGASQPTVQRAQDALHAANKLHADGKARARHWIAPPCREFLTSLLLPAALPSG